MPDCIIHKTYAPDPSTGNPVETGVAVVFPSPNTGLTIEEIAAKDVPDGVEFAIVSMADLPDKTLRNAWRMDGGAIREDLPAAREVVHARRRARRDEEMAPHDIAVTIPAQAQAAERARQEIRQRYEAIQDQIDAAQDLDALKEIMRGLNDT